MKKIKIKITEGGCNSDPCTAAAPLPAERHMAKMMARDKHMHTSDCEKSKYKNAHNGEEARMHRTTLAHLMADVKVLLDLVDDEDDLPEWLETKITKAGDYMSSAARYIAGNQARDMGQLEEKKNCGCGQDPCITYGTLEEQVVLTADQIDSALQGKNQQELISLIKSLPVDEETLSGILVPSQVSEPDTATQVAEGLVGLTEEILVESHFNMYDYLQDAIDENGETPCPQCLYEVLSEATCGCPDLIPEAKYRGRKVKLNKPMRGDVKKFKVYVKNAKGNVVKVNFGDKKMRIKKSNPKRRKSFRARHNCKNPGPKWKARYWSCRKW